MKSDEMLKELNFEKETDFRFQDVVEDLLFRYRGIMRTPSETTRISVYKNGDYMVEYLEYTNAGGCFTKRWQPACVSPKLHKALTQILSEILGGIEMKKQEIEKMLLDEFNEIYPSIFKSFELKDEHIEMRIENHEQSYLYGIPYRSGIEDFMNSDAAAQKMVIYSVFMLGDLPQYKLS